MAENYPTYYSKHFQATERIYAPVSITMAYMHTVCIIYAYFYNRKKKSLCNSFLFFFFFFFSQIFLPLCLYIFLLSQIFARTL